MRDQCDDGARCHHNCYVTECSRRDHASPLSNTGCETWEEFDEMNKKMLSDARWSKSDVTELKLALSGKKMMPSEYKQQFGVTRRTVESWLKKKVTPSFMSRLKARAFIARHRRELEGQPRRSLKKKVPRRSQRVEFPTATAKPPRFRFFLVPDSGCHPDYVVAQVVQGSEPNSVKRDPVVVGNVRDVGGGWAARWSCPHQSTKRQVVVSGYSTREEAALALLEAKEALKLS